MADDVGEYVGAIDQGTSSSRFNVYSIATGQIVASHQVELKQEFPQEGWVEMDAVAIAESVVICMDKCVEDMKSKGLDVGKLKRIGVTNQRETTVAWEISSGKPLFKAIVWLDTRTKGIVDRLIEGNPGKDKDCLRPKCGLPISTYFSALKIRWLMENVKEVGAAIERNDCLVGTIDSWLVYKLTGVHATDVTNASRTMLMNYETLRWDDSLCEFFAIPKQILPEIKSSSELFGKVNNGSLAGAVISGVLGDQHAALVGHGCLEKGQAKNTYGTGCFLLYNTGETAVVSNNGLLTTLAYKMGPSTPPVYALEGSLAIAGALIRWLRDNLGIIAEARDVEALASKVSDTGDVYFVPAFSGLFAPYWQPDARGVIVGLTQFTNKSHIARASLEAVCLQTRELLDAMAKDSGIALDKLYVDGGMTANNLLMCMQADTLGIDVCRSKEAELTIRGAAIAAVGLQRATGLYSQVRESDTFTPTSTQSQRDAKYVKWKAAVGRSMGWCGDQP